MSSPLAPIYSSGQRYSRDRQDSVATVDVELSLASYLLEMIGALPIRLYLRSHRRRTEPPRGD